MLQQVISDEGCSRCCKCSKQQPTDWEMVPESTHGQGQGAYSCTERLAFEGRPRGRRRPERLTWEERGQGKLRIWLVSEQ